MQANLVHSSDSDQHDRKIDPLVPCDWLDFVIVIVLVCAFINVTSLVIGVPAIYFSYKVSRVIRKACIKRSGGGCLYCM